MFGSNNAQSVEAPKAESEQDIWELDNDHYGEAREKGPEKLDADPVLVNPDEGQAAGADPLAADPVMVKLDDAKSEPGPAAKTPVAEKVSPVEELPKSSTPVPLASPKAAAENNPAPASETKLTAPVVTSDQPKEPAALEFTAKDLQDMQALELTTDSVKLLIEKFKFTSVQAALDFYSETSKWDYRFASIQKTLQEVGCVADESEAKALNANTTDYFLSLWFLIVRDGVKPDQAKQELRSAIAANEDKWKLFTDKYNISFKKCGLFAMGIKKEKWEHISFDQVQVISTNGPDFGRKSLKDRIATVNDWIAKKSKDNDAKQDNRPASPKPTVPDQWGESLSPVEEVDSSSRWGTDPTVPAWPMVDAGYNPRDDFHFRNRTNFLVMKSRHHVYVVEDVQLGHHHSIKVYRGKRP